MSKNALNPAISSEKNLIDACALIIKSYFPILLTFLSGLLLFTIDRISLSNYSKEVLAASGPATYTSMVLLTLFTTGIAYTRTKVAIANGKGDKKIILSEISSSIASSFIISLILLALGFFAYYIPDFSSRDAVTLLEEKAYLLFFPLFGFFAALNSCFSSILIALLKSKFVLYVSLVEHTLNAILTVSLVYGYWVLPELGIKGAAIGTAIALAVSTLLYCVLLSKQGCVSLGEFFCFLITGERLLQSCHSTICFRCIKSNWQCLLCLAGGICEHSHFNIKQHIGIDKLYLHYATCCIRYHSKFSNSK
ncbi:MATE family efflux transporter [Pseudoalteromonas piscicida]|uniref:MATE family efflux transporter n=1 Tax=Pseudoalteromonas piscicida TaxID=43662 RepID=UPI000E35F1AC|nr:MATE family efflux transporter [Pseudoalteromonas piscicida]AXQ99559.1 hypothetical protein D0N37_18760 [Pseudoalteromonas piscicida]